MKIEGQQPMDYKQEVVEFVTRQVALGRKQQEVLRNIGVSRSTYSNWRSEFTKPEVLFGGKGPLEPKVRGAKVKITPAEVERILDTKRDHPDKRHRVIQGLIQAQGYFVSASTVFKVLKAHDMVESYERRESPWKKPRYSVWARNLLWGTDWTKIKINHETWHLLTVIDFFSRKIVAWFITPQVNSSHIKAIYSKALAAEGITGSMAKPRLRADQGSPNTARVTRSFFSDLADGLLTFARVHRPTDNALTERFYGTIKQEEIYLVGSYPDLTSAEQEISAYIEYYNDSRPHQALWNFAPNYVHQINNKSLILAELEEMRFAAKNRRREYWSLVETVEFQKRQIERFQGDLVKNQVRENLSNLSKLEKA
jgi:transposase InsO family protein